MFVIPCPWCGPRDQSEFSYGGEAHISRPEDASGMSDAEWAEYVFMRSNSKGLFAERWVHTAGCRRWFNMLRNTASDRILAVHRPGEAAPAVDDAGPATPSGEPAIGSGNDATRVIRDDGAAPDGGGSSGGAAP